MPREEDSEAPGPQANGGTTIAHGTRALNVPAETPPVDVEAIKSEIHRLRAHALWQARLTAQPGMEVDQHVSWKGGEAGTFEFGRVPGPFLASLSETARLSRDTSGNGNAQIGSPGEASDGIQPPPGGAHDVPDSLCSTEGGSNMASHGSNDTPGRVGDASRNLNGVPNGSKFLADGFDNEATALLEMSLMQGGPDMDGHVPELGLPPTRPSRDTDALATGLPAPRHSGAIDIGEKMS